MYGILQDGLWFWFPRFGFRIPITNGISDSLSRIPYSMSTTPNSRIQIVLYLQEAIFCQLNAFLFGGS